MCSELISSVIDLSPAEQLPLKRNNLMRELINAELIHAEFINAMKLQKFHVLQKKLICMIHN